MDSKEFMTTIVPRLAGPSIRIRIVKDKTTILGEYSAPRELATFCSPLFASTFRDNDERRKGEECSIDLPETDGVVSCESLEMLLQWFYQQQVNVSNNRRLSMGQQISRLIEFAHLLNYVGIQGGNPAVSAVTQKVRKILAEDDAPLISHLSFLTISHLGRVFDLPKGHKLQTLLIVACVRSKIETEVDRMPCGYLGSEFRDAIRKLPGATAKLEEFIRTALAKAGNHCPMRGAGRDRKVEGDTELYMISGRTDEDWYVDPLTGKLHKHFAWKDMSGVPVVPSPRPW